MPDLAIIIPVLNRCETTLACLQALHDGLPDNFHIIVVDSGSTDGTQAAIEKNFPGVVLLQTDPEKWWAGATNTGIRYAAGQGVDYILTYNDDNIASPGDIQVLLESAVNTPGAIISAVICFHSDPDYVMFAGRRRSRITDRFYIMDFRQPVSGLPKGLRRADLLLGMCTLFPASVFREVGMFDEESFPHLFADDDLVLRAAEKGYRILVNLDVRVLNDIEKTSLNPYTQKTGIKHFWSLLTSRKSAFQINTRTRFLWRHRRSLVRFFITWISDYTRLPVIVLVKSCLSENAYERLSRFYQEKILRWQE